jgi:hypothetical protein
MMTWIMVVTLLSGEIMLGGEYQTLERCNRAITMQGPWWRGQHVKKFECKAHGAMDRRRIRI